MKNLLFVVAIAALAFVSSAQENSGLSSVPWVKTNEDIGIVPALSFCMNPKRTNIDYINSYVDDLVCLFVPPETLSYNNGSLSFPSIDLPMGLPSIDIDSLIVQPILNSNNYENLACTCVYPINRGDADSETSSPAGDDSSSADYKFPLPSYDGSSEVPLQCTCKDGTVSNQIASAQIGIPEVDLNSALPDDLVDLPTVPLSSIPDLDNLVPLNCGCGWPFPKLVNDLIRSRGTNQSWVMCRCNRAIPDGTRTAVIEGTNLVFPITNATWSTLDVTLPALDPYNVQGADSSVLSSLWSAFVPMANTTFYGGEVVSMPPFFNVTAQ